MQDKAKAPETQDCELEQELIGILNAISIVSKRLAKKLSTLQRQDLKKGGTHDGQDE